MMQERGIAGGSFDHQPLGSEVRPRIGQTHRALIYEQRTTCGESMKRTSSVLRQWKYLYRAVDSQGNTLDLRHECETLRRSSAERFLRKTLKTAHTQTPRVINVDKNAAYPPAIEDLKAEEELPKTTELRQVKYLNNTVALSSQIPARD
jgi:transposase-like protein